MKEHLKPITRRSGTWHGCWSSVVARPHVFDLPSYDPVKAADAKARAGVRVMLLRKFVR
jgi:hypothetical protein